MFADLYLAAHALGLKGCTTFRFNPEAFQGVLVKESDLENTTYRFTLEDGSVVELKGNEEIASFTSQSQVDAFMEANVTPEMRERLAKLNPTASARLANRLIEASARSYWTPDADMLRQLQQASDELEDRLEGVYEPASN